MCSRPGDPRGRRQMRNLTSPVLGFLLFLLPPSTVSFARSQEKSFIVELKNSKHGFWTLLSMEEGHWVCKTEAFPYAKALHDPFQEFNWEALESSAKSFGKSCARTFLITNRLQEKEKRLEVCSEAPAFQRLKSRIDLACRKI